MRQVERCDELWDACKFVMVQQRHDPMSTELATGDGGWLQTHFQRKRSTSS